MKRREFPLPPVILGVTVLISAIYWFVHTYDAAEGCSVLETQHGRMQVRSEVTLILAAEGLVEHDPEASTGVADVYFIPEGVSARHVIDRATQLEEAFEQGGQFDLIPGAGSQVLHLLAGP